MGVLLLALVQILTTRYGELFNPPPNMMTDYDA